MHAASAVVQRQGWTKGRRNVHALPMTQHAYVVNVLAR